MLVHSHLCLSAVAAESRVHWRRAAHKDLDVFRWGGEIVLDQALIDEPLHTREGGTFRLVGYDVDDLKLVTMGGRPFGENLFSQDLVAALRAVQEGYLGVVIWIAQQSVEGLDHWRNTCATSNHSDVLLPERVLWAMSETMSRTLVIFGLAV